jgi:8-oxo-dGTP diphosphatase
LGLRFHPDSAAGRTDPLYFTPLRALQDECPWRHVSWRERVARQSGIGFGAKSQACPAASPEFACAVLIDIQDRFLLQQRDDIPGILFPGRVGLIRELLEELGYFVAPDCFRLLTSYDGIAHSDGATARGEIFVAENIPADRLAVTEGSLLIVAQAELAAIKHRLSPSASLASNTWLADEGRGADRRPVNKKPVAKGVLAPGGAAPKSE